MRPTDEVVVADPEVRALADGLLDVWLGEHPILATQLGFHEYDAEVPDPSRSAEQERRAAYGSIRERSERLDPSTLDDRDRVTRSVVIARCEQALDAIDARWVAFDVGVALAGAPSVIFHSAPRIELADATQAVAFAQRCRRFAPMLEAAAERLREGMASGLTPGHRATRASIDEIDRHLGLPLDEDPLVTVATRDELSDGGSWREDIRSAVAEAVRPALQAYRDVLEHEVAPVARPDDRAGLCWLDDGADLYASAVRAATTTDRTPDEIHDIGRELVEQIVEEFRVLGGRALGSGDPTATSAQLRHDPELRYRSGAEMRETAVSAIARANAAVGDWFGRSPETPCEVREIPPLEAVTAPAAYYQPPAVDGTRPGTYWINTTGAEGRTRFDAEAIAFHEGVPGHHLQLALAQELALPLIRRLSVFNAYAEGWGLYAEALAGEMGLYSDDLQRLGALSLSAMRACRLVVDTGLHHHGWSRDEAIRYILEHSAWPEPDVPKEVDRYLVIPGQALGYQIGRLEILELRDLATDRLGRAFDLPGFHDVVLGHGSLPLTVLRELVEAWSLQR